MEAGWDWESGFGGGMVKWYGVWGVLAYVARTLQRYQRVLGSGLQTSSLVSSNDGSNKTLQGIGDDSGKDGLDSLSNATDTVNIGSDELSQQKQSFSNESQQENGGGSMAPEHKSPVEASVSNGIPETAKENTEGASNCLGNEGDGGKSNLSGQSNTSDTVNIGSNEMSQQKEPLDNENGQETGGNSTALEHNSMSEANANISLENVSNDAAETAEENEEGVFDCLGSLGVTGKVAAKLLPCYQEVTGSSLGNSLWQKCKARIDELVSIAKEKALLSTELSLPSVFAISQSPSYIEPLQEGMIVADEETGETTIASDMS
ncbi:putative peptide-N4-(N-acetyl-beta-glucosaminyl)asparagine amidase A-like [Capsicum annuum]|nr:putative peptide-N4-(N-acetyl-beta-glucosaminyl)asparagine amidase A-like [Capsicum annuum]